MKPTESSFSQGRRASVTKLFPLRYLSAKSSINLIGLQAASDHCIAFTFLPTDPGIGETRARPLIVLNTRHRGRRSSDPEAQRGTSLETALTWPPAAVRAKPNHDSANAVSLYWCPTWASSGLQGGNRAMNQKISRTAKIVFTPR